MLTIKPIPSQPGNAPTDWPTTSKEYAPGKTGLDGAKGHKVVIHDWYGDISGMCIGWSGGSTSPTLFLHDAKRAGSDQVVAAVAMKLMASRSIDVY